MQIDILTPEKKLFSGQATGVKLPGIAGGFEILENHAPIIAALQEGTIEINTNGKIQKIEIADGFAECINNNVSILIAGGTILE